jgi:hypothetical protein
MSSANAIAILVQARNRNYFLLNVLNRERISETDPHFTALASFLLVQQAAF